MWCIPPKHSAEFVCAMENVLEVYQRPYDPKRPVVCMDESSKQLVKETRVPIAAAPGCVRCFDHEYERNGVANVFMFCEPLRGWRRVEITDRRTKVDWAKQIQTLVDVEYPEADRITLVMDNLNTHAMASLYEAFTPTEARRLIGRLEPVYTPKHGSWLDIAEIELNVLGRQCLDRRIPDKPTLISEVGAWESARNAVRKPVNWRFTADDARIKLKRLYPQFEV